MSLKIGTNIDYKAKRFLDERINLPSTLQDLKDWSTPIPEGFEVFVDGRWYVYRSTFEFDDTTGYWRKRIDNEYSGSELEQKDTSQDNNIDLLMRKVFPLSFDGISAIPDNGGTYDVGKEIEKPVISWAVKREENGRTVRQQLVLEGSSKTTVTSDKADEVMGDIIREFGADNGTYNYKYYHPGNITSGITFTISAVSKIGMTLTGTLSYYFCFGRYWGITSNNSRSYFEGKKFRTDFPIIGHDLTENWAKGKTIFDCTGGGLHPFYIVPKKIEKGTFWIGGYENNNWSEYLGVKIKNQYDKEAEYNVYVLIDEASQPYEIQFIAKVK